MIEGCADWGKVDHGNVWKRQICGWIVEKLKTEKVIQGSFTALNYGNGRSGKSFEIKKILLSLNLRILFFNINWTRNTAENNNIMSQSKNEAIKKYEGSKTLNMGFNVLSRVWFQRNRRWPWNISEETSISGLYTSHIVKEAWHAKDGLIMIYETGSEIYKQCANCISVVYLIILSCVYF